METNLGWLPRETGIYDKSRRDSGAGQAPSHRSTLDIQAFSPRKRGNRKRKATYRPGETCALFFRKTGWEG